MSDREKTTRFEAALWPHMGAAYNLARWLARRDSDAEDIIQEAMLRAFRFFDGFRGGNERAWLLTIVRNTAYTWLRQHRAHEAESEFEKETALVPDRAPGPEAQAMRSANLDLLRRGLESMPLEFREILVLRDLEGLSYKEISDVSGLPMGTIMSRLSRARDRLQQALVRRPLEEMPHDL